MSGISRVLANANAVVFMLLALASVREYRRGHGAAPAWAATAFVTLGVVASFGFLPAREVGDPLWDQLWWQLVVRVLVAMIVAFAYFLYRMAATFHPPSPWVRRGVDALTAAVIGVGFVLPRFPGPGEPRPTWLLPYIGAIVFQWTATSAFAAAWLWRGGSDRPSGPRHRMRLLALGTVALNLLILVSVVRPRSDPQDPNHVLQVLNFLTGCVFFIGLAPPHALVERWRRPEQHAARAAMAELMTAVSASEVATSLLPHVAQMVGAESAALYNEDGALFASHGTLAPGSERDDEAASPASGVLRFPLRSGGALVVRGSSYSPLFGDDKVEVLRSFANLADLALARCAALAREREFISNAAHELRTPLTTMTALAETLAANLTRMSSDQIDESLAAMTRQGDRARELVNNLLDMAYIERGKAPFADEVVVLSDVISQSLAAVPAPEGWSIHVDVPADVCVRGDAARLRQVLVNLVNNAFRHGGAEVYIDAHADGNGVVLSVADDGAGVSPELVPTMFDPFSRAAAEHGSGSGLGLAICRQIVKGLGGSIVYESTSGRGARFKIALRRAA